MIAAPFIDAILEMLRVGLLRRTLREAAGFLALAAICVGAAFFADFICAAIDGGQDLFVENGPIETIQAILVGLAAALFYLAALRLDFEIFYGALMRSLGSGLALLREIPGCASHFYDSGVCLGDCSKDGLTVLLVAVVTGLALLRRGPLARHLRELGFFWLVPSGIAFAILVAGEAMEHLHFEAYEETLELAGYLDLVVFALALNLKPERFDARRARPLPPPGAWRR